MTDALAGRALIYWSQLVTWSRNIVATTAAVEGKMGKGLKKLLKKVFASSAHDTLAVADSKLGNLIKVTIKLM